MEGYCTLFLVKNSVQLMLNIIGCVFGIEPFLMDLIELNMIIKEQISFQCSNIALLLPVLLYLPGVNSNLFIDCICLIRMIGHIGNSVS